MRNRNKELFIGFLLLLCGCLIYLLFRSKTIRLYQWCEWAGLSESIDSLRQLAHGWQLSDFVLYSLPDGLYCASYILVMNALWNGGKKSRMVMVSLIPMAAICHELLQAMGLVRGTFDPVDLLCYVLPLTVFFLGASHSIESSN